MARSDLSPSPPDSLLLNADAPKRPARQILLLCNDPAWFEVAMRVTAEHGDHLERAANPSDALQRLVQPTHSIAQLLLEPASAGSLVGDLVGVTAGETGSQVELVLLGDLGGLAMPQAVRHARNPGELANKLYAQTVTARKLSLSTSEIALAFDGRNVEVRFQPIVSLDDRRPVGMETLVRWQHRDHGIIGPDQFIPQIERAGLSLRLTDAVAEAAMGAISPGLLSHYHLFLSINLPLDVLLFPEALQRIERHRQNFGIAVEQILIELTESRPVSDLDGLSQALMLWRQAGYRVAIDDIGPEMMNQINLFDLPFNVVKLDKQIVLRSQIDPLARNYLKRTITNAKSRSLEVIAEGIENEAMWVRMRDLGVEFAQGFLIARALPASAMPTWLDAWSKQNGLPPDRIPT